MPFATWWRGDPLPVLPPLPTFSGQRWTDRPSIRRLTRLTEAVVEARLEAGHELYAACLEGEPVGYGWAAMRTGGIDELDFSFMVPDGDCYLWDFVTLPPWRGRGVYPRLLQAIVRQQAGADRFWIGYEARNAASARGIEKAGFQVVGELAVVHGRVTGFEPSAPGERTEAAARLFTPPAIPRWLP